MMIFFIRIIALNLLFISFFSKHVAQLCVVANDALDTNKVGHMTASINRIQNLWTTNLIKAVPNKPCMQYISFLKSDNQSLQVYPTYYRGSEVDDSI